MINIDGIIINTSEELENYISEFSELTKVYLRNLFNGEVNTPVVEIRSITPRQARLVLMSIGITAEMVIAAINTLSSPTKEVAMITWEYSTEFHRNNPLVSIMGQLMGKTAEQLDELWIVGLTL